MTTRPRPQNDLVQITNEKTGETKVVKRSDASDYVQHLGWRLGNLVKQADG